MIVAAGPASRRCAPLARAANLAIAKRVTCTTSIATRLWASPSSSGPFPSRMVASSLWRWYGCIRDLKLLGFHSHGTCVNGRSGDSFSFVSDFKETCVGTSNSSSNCDEDCLPDKLCARTTRAGPDLFHCHFVWLAKLVFNAVPLLSWRRRVQLTRGVICGAFLEFF